MASRFSWLSPHEATTTGSGQSNGHSNLTSADGSWSPLEKMAKGVAIASFAPPPEFSYAATINAGDDVYIFEQHKSGQWYRGYAVGTPKLQSAFNQPISRSQKLVNTGLKPLGSSISTGIIPVSYVRIKEYYRFNFPTMTSKEGGEAIKSLLSEYSSEPFLSGLRSSVDGILDKVPHKPDLEGKEGANGIDSGACSEEPLIEDIASVIREWFYTYSVHHFIYGNYPLVSAIHTAINDLHLIRKKLMYGLLTSNERIIVRKKAVWLISRVSKLVKRGIVVREPTTGKIMSADEGPVKLVQEQMLLALAPDYPDHAVVGNENVKQATLPKHILVDFKSVVGEASGAKGLSVLFSLCTRSSLLTEAFSIPVSRDTVLADLSAVLFADLPVAITKDDLFLVAALYQEVPLKSTNPKFPAIYSQLLGPAATKVRNKNDTNALDTPRPVARRGIAAGAADISRLFRMESSEESMFTLRMFTNYFSSGEPNDDNKGWGELVERIIRGRAGGVALTSRAEQVVCTVKEFEATTIRNVDQIREQGSDRAVSLAKSLFVNSLSEYRDDIYINLGKIALAYTGSISVSEYLTVTVTSQSGETWFSTSSNGLETTTWESIAVFDKEVIGEMIRASRSPNVSDETLSLNLYVGGKYLGTGTLGLTHSSGRIIVGKRSVQFQREGVTVASLQTTVDYVGNSIIDSTVDRILNWRLVYENNGIEELITVLEHYVVVEPKEILRKFHDIMDALLDMLYEFVYTIQGNDALLELIFQGLVTTLEKATARNTEHTYLGDDYLRTRFNLAGMSEILLKLVTNSFDLKQSTVIDSEQISFMKDVAKTGEYISRLVAQSGNIDSERGKELQISMSMTVKSYLRKLSECFKRLVSRDEPDLVELQATIVKHLFHWYDNLCPFVAKDDAVQLLIEVVDSIRTDSDSVNTDRLLLIRQISDSWIFLDMKYRPHLTAYTIKWTLPFWTSSENFTSTKKEHIRLMCGIFAIQFKILWPLRHKETEVCKRYGQLLPLGASLYTELLEDFQNSNRRSNTVYSPLFPDKYPFEVFAIDSMVNDAVFDETLIEMGIVFTLLVNIAHFSGHHLLDNSLSLDQLTDLAFNIIRACGSMLDCVSFPKTWVSALAIYHETVFGCLDYLSKLLRDRFIPSPDNAHEFKAELWYSFLDCLSRLVGSEVLAIEHLPEQNRMAIWNISRDLRQRAVELLKDCWDSIGWPTAEDDQLRFGLKKYGGFQVQLFGGETSLVRNIVNICLLRHPKIQSVATEILQSMIVGEWELNEDLTSLQREMIVALDETFQSKEFPPETFEKKTFINFLRSSFDLDPEDDAVPFFIQLVDHVEEFLDLLLDLYSIPNSETYSDDRIFHALNVLNFLKDIDRIEIFIRYVNTIAQWNKARMNFTQTGLALRLLSTAYEWSYDQKLPASEDPSFPMQTGFERKEALYEEIIHNFTRGRAFENAIDATKELITAYETVAFDFKKLASVSRVLSKLYESVDTVERLSPQYFRVAYFGVGFPRSLRNKQFIFEGAAWENLESFHERLVTLYPGAKIVGEESEAQADGQYLVVNAVVQEATGTNHPRWQSLSGGAKEYYNRLNLKYFSHVRPLPGNSSPLDLWVEKTTYETYQVFPTIVKRSEIKQAITVKLSPLENALQTLEENIDDLIDLENMFQTSKPKSTKSVQSK